MTGKKPLRLVNLSAEQEALLRVVREEWMAVGTATGPADRQEALAGVRAAYRRAGLPHPSRVLWFDSPLAAAVAMRRHNLTSPVADVIRRAQNRFDHRATGWASQPTLDTIHREVSTPLRHWGERWHDLIGDELRDHSAVLPYPTWGQHDVSELGVQDLFARLGVDGAEPPVDLMRVASRVGWWWVFRGTVVLTERPDTLVRDRHGRAHNPDGPAVRYPDGFAVYARHGVRVPRRVGTGELTGADWLDEERSQVRQAIAERMGYRWMLANVPAERLDTDNHGTLWRIREYEADYHLTQSAVDPEDIWMVELAGGDPAREAAVWRVEPGRPTVEDAAEWVRRRGEDYRPRRPNTHGRPPETRQDADSGRQWWRESSVRLTGPEHANVVAFGELDGRPVVATDGADGTVVLWDPLGPRRLFVLGGHSGGVAVLAFGRVGGRPVLAGGGHDRVVTVWDLADRAPMTTVTVDDGTVVDIAFVDIAFVGSAADRDVLATASNSVERSWRLGRVDLWDAATGEHVRTLHRDDEEDVKGLAVVRVGGRTALAAAHWFTVRLWDVATGEQLQTWGGEDAGAASDTCQGDRFAAFTAPLLHGVVDGRTVLGAVLTERCGADSHGPDHDEFLVVYLDVETSAEVARTEFTVNERPVAMATVNGTGYLATATETWHYHLRRTRLRIYRPPHRTVAEFSADAGDVRSADLGVVDGSLRLATAHDRGSARLWSVPSTM
ncbi:DUF6745 domain-containing protein [Virgisporangium aurantiacum]|uniref:DUF6745 domain-containing protein n=1 Tax=Virgisporangium aurantiacum TaxID=175570 RepID=A0A8J3Z986_9ACTN|nr:hypothetical protein [Virgisporangium aurantiacum]GIJ57203.1 hypothetical protein Vau01_047190 [Virgisporangium aurantiacum]